MSWLVTATVRLRFDRCRSIPGRPYHVRYSSPSAGGGGGGGSSLKQHSSPYVSPGQIWSFWVKGCPHKWKRTTNLGSGGALASRLSRSRKVIGTDADRSATYNLTFHSNHAPITRTVSEINGNFSQTQFSTPCLCNAAAEEFCLRLRISQKHLKKSE